eukprot:Opistho-1_new@61761
MTAGHSSVALHRHTLEKARAGRLLRCVDEGIIPPHLEHRPICAERTHGRFASLLQLGLEREQRHVPWRELDGALNNRKCRAVLSPRTQEKREQVKCREERTVRLEGFPHVRDGETNLPDVGVLERKVEGDAGTHGVQRNRLMKVVDRLAEVRTATVLKSRDDGEPCVRHPNILCGARSEVCGVRRRRPASHVDGMGIERFLWRTPLPLRLRQFERLGCHLEGCVGLVQRGQVRLRGVQVRKHGLGALLRRTQLSQHHRSAFVLPVGGERLSKLLPHVRALERKAHGPVQRLRARAKQPATGQRNHEEVVHRRHFRGELGQCGVVRNRCHGRAQLVAFLKL